VQLVQDRERDDQPSARWYARRLRRASPRAAMTSASPSGATRALATGDTRVSDSSASSGGGDAGRIPSSALTAPVTPTSQATRSGDRDLAATGVRPQTAPPSAASAAGT